MVENEGFSANEQEILILSGHRDTHFSFVRDLQLGDKISMQTLPGTWHTFIVEKVEVIDSRIDRLKTKQETNDLRLITCYPFDALVPGGPLRYIVTARQISRENHSYRVTSANTGWDSREGSTTLPRG